MKMRALRFTSVLLLSALLVSCGDDERASSHGGKSLVEITIDNVRHSARVRVEENTLYARARLFLAGLLDELASRGEAVAAIPATVNTIAFTISAPDMPAMTKEVLVAGQDSVTETFLVENGLNRVFLAEGKDGGGVVRYRGSTTANLDGSEIVVDIYLLQAGSSITGVLDTAFNGTGYIRHNGAGGTSANEMGYAITLDSSGRILVAGYGQSSGFNDDMVIWRYNANGTLDTTFNGTGFVSHNDAAGGNGVDRGYAITTDSTGRILVAGSSQTAIGDGNMAIWRYNADGTLDTTFNGTGFLNHDGGSGVLNSNELGNGIVVDSSGKIVVVGGSTNAAAYFDLVVWRYNANGTLDTSFNGSGYVRHNGAAGGNYDDMGQAVAIDSSGKIVVAGYSCSGAPNTNIDMTIWRFDGNGALDTAFNTVGYVSHNGAAGGNGHDFGYGMTIDLSGKILVAGWGPNASGNEDMIVWRYNANGTLDTAFNGTGYVTHDAAAGGANSPDRGYAIRTDSAGNILVAGKSWNGANEDIVLWRYTGNGVLDTTLNGTGFIVQNGPGGFNNRDIAYGLAVDSSGNVLVTGDSVNAVPQSDLVILRYK